MYLLVGLRASGFGELKSYFGTLSSLKEAKIIYVEAS